jgi:putative flippase GtrA
MIALAVANWLLVLALVEKLGMHYLLSIVLATVLLSMANFMMQKLWVFGRKPARR